MSTILVQLEIFKKIHFNGEIIGGANFHLETADFSIEITQTLQS